VSAHASDFLGSRRDHLGQKLDAYLTEGARHAPAIAWKQAVSATPGRAHPVSVPASVHRGPGSQH